VYIEKASQVHSANVQEAEAHRGFRQRLKFQREAALDAIRILVILHESHDDRRPEEAAIADGRASWKWIRKRIGRIIGIRAVFHQTFQSQSGERRRAGKSKELRLCIKPVLEWSTWVLPNRSAAGRLLTSEQRRGNDAVEEPEARSHHNVVLRSQAIGQTDPRIEVLPLGVEHMRRPSLPFPPNAAVQCQPICGAPLVLNV